MSKTPLPRLLDAFVDAIRTARKNGPATDAEIADALPQALARYGMTITLTLDAAQPNTRLDVERLARVVKAHGAGHGKAPLPVHCNDQCAAAIAREYAALETSS